MRRVIFFARYEASQLGSQYIGTEHLLLGLLREDKALGNRFLRSPAAVQSIRKQVEGHTTVCEKVSTDGDLPFSDECKRVADYGVEEAGRLNHKHIGTEHLLLGLLREEKSFAAELLHQHGLRISTIREELARSQSEKVASSRPEEGALPAARSRIQLSALPINSVPDYLWAHGEEEDDSDDQDENYSSSRRIFEPTGKIRFTSQDHRFLRALAAINFDEQIIEVPLIQLATSLEEVQVVNAASRLLDEAKIGLEQLLQLSPRQFEEIVGEIFDRFGYQVELTRRTRDGGRDIVAIKRVEICSRILIECKRYSPDHHVGIRIVRELYGIKNHEGVTKAFLATTSTFTQPAGIFLGAHKWELEGRDYHGILDWIRLVKGYHRRS